MTDPGYIKDPENFHSDQWDHARIASAVAGMNVENVSGIARAWAELGTTAHDAIVEFSDAIKKTISESWHGAAASAAYRETERYSTSAPQAQQQLHGVADALTPLAETVASLRSQVPETIGTGLWDKLTPWDTDTEDEYYRREGEAREKMATIYNPGLVTSDGNVPSFTKPESIVDVPSGPAGPGVDYASGTPSSSDRLGGPSAGQPTSGDVPVSDPSAVPGAPAVDDTQQNAATAPSAVTTPATTSSATGDQAQNRSGIPSSADSSSGAGSRSAGVGGSSGGGGPGVGGLVGGVGAGNQPGAMARPGTAPGVAGANAGGRAGAGMRGTGPMGGGMMGGAGGAKGGGEDKEHKTPDYLITLDNGNELIGKLPLVSPPVIGA